MAQARSPADAWGQLMTPGRCSPPKRIGESFGPYMRVPCSAGSVLSCRLASWVRHGAAVLKRNYLACYEAVESRISTKGVLARPESRVRGLPLATLWTHPLLPERLPAGILWSRAIPTTSRTLRGPWADRSAFTASKLACASTSISRPQLCDCWSSARLSRRPRDSRTRAEHGASYRMGRCGQPPTYSPGARMSTLSSTSA